jgi:hypothetical protein
LFEGAVSFCDAAGIYWHLDSNGNLNQQPVPMDIGIDLKSDR